MVKLGCPLQPLLTMNAGMKMNFETVFPWGKGLAEHMDNVQHHGG